MTHSTISIKYKLMTGLTLIYFLIIHKNTFKNIFFLIIKLVIEKYSVIQIIFKNTFTYLLCLFYLIYIVDIEHSKV